jgi:uncharacterized protein YgiB involved in biofilm formation
MKCKVSMGMVMGDQAEFERAISTGMLAVAERTAREKSPVGRRAPRRITLVLIGATTVGGCSDPAPEVVNRDLYETRGRCVQDWGDEKKCDLITDGQYRGHWYGPGYVGARTSAPGYRGSPDGGSAAGVASGKGTTSNAVGTHRVTRSGFGSSSSAHSSGS